MTLPVEVEAFVTEQIAAGKYPTAAAVLSDAVQALREKQALDHKQEELRKEIQLGLDDIAAGRVGPWDIDEILAEVLAEKTSRVAEAS